MGTWSITGSGGTDLVSIDNTGKLTYQEHTEDRVYTISYSDDTCGTITKDITIKGCGSPGEYHLNTTLIFQGIVQGASTNPIFNSLTIRANIHDSNDNVVWSEENIGYNGCPCFPDCHEDFKTFRYERTLDERVQLDPSKPLSDYTIELVRSTAIARDWYYDPMDPHCNYTYNNWNEPSGTFQHPGSGEVMEAKYTTTLDKLVQSQYMFMITFNSDR